MYCCVEENMKKSKKKQIEQVYLDDHYGSVSQTFLTVRSVLWGVVEHIANTDDEHTSSLSANTSITAQSSSVHVDECEEDQSMLALLGLPVGFSSSKTNNKKRKPFPDSSMSSQPHGLSEEEQSKKRSRKSKQRKLPILEDHGDKLIEQNIGFYLTEQGTQKWFRVLGLAPSKGCSIGTMVRESRVAAAENESEKEGEGVRQVIETSLITIRYLHSQQRDVLDRMDQRVFIFNDHSYQHQCSSSTYETTSNLSQKAYEEAESDLWEAFNWNKPPDVHEKYWDQRYRIFSRFDDKVLLDSESWYSITYEQIGHYVAERYRDLLTNSHQDLHVVLDCFSGCGGCTIPFALQDSHVIAVDMDDLKLKYLQ